MTVSADLHALARGVIAVGFAGTSVTSAPLEELRSFAPGGVTLFARNAGTAQQLRELIAALRATGSPAPLIAVDQEGGRVERIRDAVAALPSAMAVGATGDVAVAEGLGALLGRDLARVGIDVDFAPVADLSLHPDSAVVGTRAYGDDPERVAAFASAFARGLERGGVAATLKHFPGHGATSGDSHTVLPRVPADAATLRARDLIPFRRGIEGRAASIVMAAHVVVEAFDADRPATLSRRILTGVLREELGFEGVIATDCLEMDAIARGAGTVRGAVQALAAGADLLLISHRIALAREAADAVVAAVEQGTIPLARLHDAYRRVCALRERLATRSPFAGPVDEDLPAAAARRAMTVVRGEPQLRDGKAVTVISFEGDAGDNAARSGAAAGASGTPSLSAALRRRGWKSELMRVPLEPQAAEMELLLELIPPLGDRDFVVVTRDAHRCPAQRDAVERLLAVAPHALVVCASTPYDALLWPRARRVMCTYGAGEIAFEACADVLSGRAAAAGTLPVALPRENAPVR